MAIPVSDLVLGKGIAVLREVERIQPLFDIAGHTIPPATIVAERDCDTSNSRNVSNGSFSSIHPTGS